MANRPEPCPVRSYAEAVVAGGVVAGRLVRLACQRHLDDLAGGGERGLRWDAKAAGRAIGFFGWLRLEDGQPFVLQPFQQFIVGSIFGWLGADGARRYRTAYVEIGKGNGKSPLAGAIGLYGLVADGELAAEVYSAATTREQAGILFRDAKLMAEASPALTRRLKIDVNNLADERTNSFFRPVSSEHRGLDGKRVHMALIDEVHEHPTAMVVDKMRKGTKRRRQPLVLEITNSGYDRTTVCWQHHAYSADVLEGRVTDDSWFAYVCGLDPCAACQDAGQLQPAESCPDCDQWTDEASWPKANPGLGTILPHRYLRQQVQEAQGMPAAEGITRRLNFCWWTEGQTRAIPMDRWDACARQIDPEALRGREAYAGLDIGSTSDFTALVLLFPHDDAEAVELLGAAGGEPGRTLLRRSYTLLPFFWLPEHPRRRDEKTAAAVEAWRRQGLVRTTPGEVVDYERVFGDVVELSGLYDLRECGFDRGHQGAHIGTRLMGHFGERWLWSVPQGIVTMNSPFRELLELLITGRLHHASHPVMRWMCGNCVAEERGGLIKPSKEHSAEKIDGVTAAVMALARAMVAPTVGTEIHFV